MKYLLDVSALVAFGFIDHEFHTRVVSWIHRENSVQLLTCSITELGFVRVLARTPAYRVAFADAQPLLLALKNNAAAPLHFIPDGDDISCLPDWVKHPGQTTDGHLVALASVHGAAFATLDKRIPGAFLIP